ncbi:MAG: spore maturation protein [Ruminococcus sp.]|nr:spore maturation protein [Ruminococcus sp.]
MQLFGLAAPLLIAAVLATAAVKRVDVLEEFGRGAMDGLKTAVELLPTLMLVVTVIGFAYRSGALSQLAECVTPVMQKLGFPPELVPLSLIRPVSGSGALAVFDNIISSCGADSFAGRAAAVLMGSTETTFYTVAVYFSATKLKADAGVFISSLTADVFGFIFSALVVKLYY